MSMPETTRNRVTVGLVIAVGTVALVGAVYMKRTADARDPEGVGDNDAPIAEVGALTVVASDVPLVFDMRGFLSGLEEVSVHSEVSGRVVGKPVRDGQQIESGAPLCTIDDTFYALAVRKAEANLSVARGQHREAASAVAVAEAQRRDAQAARDNANAEFERIRKLYQGDDSPEIEYERYETQYRRAEAQLTSAAAACSRAKETLAVGYAAVEVAEATLAEARESHARCHVVAPIAGTIDRTAYEVGEFVSAGQPLLELIRLDRMKLTVELTGSQAGTLLKSANAEVVVDAVSDTVYSAELSHVAPKADPRTRKFRVEFQLENADGKLRAGMFARARIQSAVWKEVVAEPRIAFFRQFGADFCFVLAERAGATVAEFRRVVLREIPGQLEQVRVISGLAPGDRLVIERPRNLADGAVVTVLPGASGRSVASPSPHALSAGERDEGAAD